MSKNRLEDDLLCAICQEIFKDPVIMTCCHSFCKVCLEQFWLVKIPRECPVCCRRCSKPSYPLNLALRNICETFQDSSSSPTPRRKGLHYVLDVVSDLSARVISFRFFRHLFSMMIIFLLLSAPILRTHISMMSPFADKNHYLHRMFLSSIWGWTCIFAGSFMFLLSFSLRRSLRLSLRHLSRLAAASAVWLGLRWLLTSFENATGSCFEPLSSLNICMEEVESTGQGSRLLLRDGESKKSCLHAGLQWRGCEVSQDVLLLCMCSLLLLEEVAVFGRCRHSAGIPLQLLFLLCVSLLGLWFFLLFCQLVYLPRYPAQQIGGALGFMTWGVLYQGWFRKETSWWCPGTPDNGLTQENNEKKDR